jgi:hypothetical protein
MIIEPCGGMATSAPGEEPLYVVCTDKNGYGFSLTRYSHELRIELMVEDQTNLPTSKIGAELYRDKLVVNVDPVAATQIGIPTEYVILLSITEEQIDNVDSTLAAIFNGIGYYERRF